METPQTKTLGMCPSDETLRAYLLGETDDSLSDSIDLHVATCPNCIQRLEALELSVESSSVEAIERNLLAAAIAAVKESSVETAPESVGSYRLIQEIGRGGMGRVYLAEHLSLKKKVAVKLLSSSLGNRQAIERFEREIQAIGRLNHPSIVTATDANTNGTHPFLVMEFIDGIDLATLLRKHGPLPTAEACEIARQVAIALQHAHQVSMVHRDIKPSNIMIDGEGRIKLMDFGLVQLKSSPSGSSELTSAGHCLGTLDYMSPEQAEESSSLDPRSDIYSLGVTLYRLLSGRFPLNFLTSQSALQKIATLQKHQLTPIQTWKPELPEQLAKLMMSMIAKAPSQRPATAAEVAEQLAPFCKSADLGSLVERLRDLTSPAIEASLSSPQPQPQVSNAGTGKRGLWWKLVAAAVLPWGAYLGINLVLSDQNGNLVVESELDNVQIRVVNDRQSSQQLTVQNGPSITKLKAGKYEIVLDSASDEASIQPNSIELKKGGTIIARVTRKDTVEPSETPSKADANENTFGLSAETLQLTYAGKTAAWHLRGLVLERDWDTWRNHLAVLNKLLTDKERNLIKPLVRERLAAFKQGYGIQGLLDYHRWYEPQEIDEQILKLITQAPLDELKGRIDELLGHDVREGPKISSINAKLWRAMEDRFSNAEPPEFLKLAGYLHHVTAARDYAERHFRSVEFVDAHPYLGFGSPRSSAAEETFESTKAKIKILYRELKRTFEKRDYVRWLWFTRIAEHLSFESEEGSQLWELVQSQLERYFEEWDKSEQVLRDIRVDVVLSGYRDDSRLGFNSDNWVVTTNQVPLDYVETKGKFTHIGRWVKILPRPFVPLDIELLFVASRLPTEYRKFLSLERVGQRLDYVANGVVPDRLEKLASWASLTHRFNEQGRLAADRDNALVPYPEEEQQAMQALVIHRWIEAILFSDLMYPETIFSQFFYSLFHPNREDARDVQSMIVTRGRGLFSKEKLVDALGKTIGYSAITPMSFEVGWKTATVVAHIGIETAHAGGMDMQPAYTGGMGMQPAYAGGMGMSSEYASVELSLELEKEGWRIAKIRVLRGRESQTLDYTTPNAIESP